MNTGMYLETEIHDEEVFIGNKRKYVPISSFYKKFKTIRLGENALDIHGTFLRGYWPMFIHKSEFDAYNAKQGARS